MGVSALVITVVGVMTIPKTNPLTEGDLNDRVNFLVNASIYAEKKLKLDNESAPGSYFNGCMKSGAKAVDNRVCQALYKQMISYAKQHKPYQHLTVKELTDQTNWLTMKSAYDQKQFNTI